MHASGSYVGLAPWAWFSIARLNDITKSRLACNHYNNYLYNSYNIRFVKQCVTEETVREVKCPPGSFTPE